MEPVSATHYIGSDGRSTPAHHISYGGIRWQRNQHRRAAVVACCRHFVAFLFSQLGLASTVVAYSILGGVVFSAIESPNEADVRQKLNAYRLERVTEIKNLTVTGLQLMSHFVAIDDDEHVEERWRNWTAFENEVERILNAFQTRVVRAINEDGWDGRDDRDPDRWSFSSAMLYAVTITTTIGYGHVTPKTSGGRFATILYAIVGIPLTFLYLSTIGNYLASVFRIFYFRVCCRCVKRCRKLSETMATTLQPSAADLPLTSSLQPSSPSRKPARNQMVNVAAASCRRVSTAVLSKINADRMSQQTTRTSTGLCQLPLANVRLGSEPDSPDCRSDTVSLSKIDRRSRQSSSVSRRVPLFAFSSCQCGSSSPIENRSDEPQQNQSLPTGRVSSSALCGRKRGVGLLDGLVTCCTLREPTGSDQRRPTTSSKSHRLATTTNVNPEVETDLRLDHAETTAPLRDAVPVKTDRLDDSEAGTPATTTPQDQRGDSSTLSLDLADTRKLSELIGDGTVRLVDRVATSHPAAHPEVDGFNTSKQITSSGSVGLIFKTCSAKLRGKLRLRHRVVFTNSSRPTTSTVEERSPPVTTVALETAGPWRSDQSEVFPDPIDEGTNSPSSGPTCDTIVHCEITEKNECGAAVTSISDGKGGTGMWRCRYVASQIGTTLRRKTTTEPSRQRSTLGSTKTEENSPSASWTTSRIGRVRKVGTRAIRWATSVKGRFTRITSFQTVTADRFSKSAVINDSAVDNYASASEMKSSNVFVRFGEFNTSTELRNGVVNDVTAAGTSSSVVVHLTTPSMSSDSFVTALDSLEWLPRFELDPCSDDVMSVDLACDEISFDEKEHREQLVIGCVASDSHSSLCKPEADGRLSVEKEAFVGGASVNPDASYLLDRHGTAVTEDAEGFHIDDQQIKLNVVEKRNAERYRRQLHRATSGSHRNVLIDEQRVPIYVCLIVIAVHICLGTLLFTLWEEWDWLTSLYFCFITLTTIGFGDVVPGTSADDWSSHEKLVLCALWLAVGLSLIAMCFNLVQEEVREKCIRAARRCGLMPPVDDV